MLIDVDESQDSSEQVAKAVRNSLEKILKMIPGNSHIVIHGVKTDSGGGGTLKSLERALRKELSKNAQVTINFD